MKPRTDAMLNGALVGLGAVSIIDNVLFHWMLHLHRAVPGDRALEVEYALIAAGMLALFIGLWRERRARAPHQ